MRWRYGDQSLDCRTVPCAASNPGAGVFPEGISEAVLQLEQDLADVDAAALHRRLVPVQLHVGSELLDGTMMNLEDVGLGWVISCVLGDHYRIDVRGSGVALATVRLVRQDLTWLDAGWW